MLAPEVLILIAGCCVVAVVAYVTYANHVNRKRRLAGLHEAAERMGLQVLDDPDGEVFRHFDNFKLFSDGYQHKITNLIVVDSEDVKISIFDYRYKTNPTGKGPTIHDQTVIALQSPQLNCPEIMMRPETFADKIDSALGFQNRGYDMRSEFSKRFILNGPDEDAVRSFFTLRVLEFFEQQPNFSLEAWEDTLFFYHRRKLCKPDELEELLARARETFSVLPKTNAQ